MSLKWSWVAGCWVSFRVRLLFSIWSKAAPETERVQLVKSRPCQQPPKRNLDNLALICGCFCMCEPHVPVFLLLRSRRHGRRHVEARHLNVQLFFSYIVSEPISRTCRECAAPSPGKVVLRSWVECDFPSSLHPGT